MALNKAARDLIVAPVLNSVVVSHDLRCYQIITSAGGYYVVYNLVPCLKYRQHANILLVGTNTSRLSS